MIRPCCGDGLPYRREIPAVGGYDYNPREAVTGKAVYIIAKDERQGLGLEGDRPGECQVMLRDADVDSPGLQRVPELAGDPLADIFSDPRVGHLRQVRTVLLRRTHGQHGGLEARLDRLLDLGPGHFFHAYRFAALYALSLAVGTECQAKREQNKRKQTPHGILLAPLFRRTGSPSTRPTKEPGDHGGC